MACIRQDSWPKKWVALATLVLCVAVSLAACGGGGGASKASAAPTGAAFTQPDHLTMPEINPNGPEIDVSHVADGYVVAHASSASRLKFQASKGDVTYNYDLPNDGTPTLYPINMGNGYYQFRIMMNTEGNSYVEYYWADAYVELTSEFAPFLIPNQFCSYVPSSACVEKARELTNDATNQGEAVRNICEFVARNTSYDKAKAEKLANESGYVPNPDETLATGRGICFDYASLSAAMLRSMGLPAKVVTGYVGEENLYHAWIMVYIDGTWETAVFSVTPNNWSRCDVTFASTGATKYSGSGTSYTDRYTY